MDSLYQELKKPVPRVGHGRNILLYGYGGFFISVQKMKKGRFWPTSLSYCFIELWSNCREKFLGVSDRKNEGIFSVSIAIQHLLLEALGAVI
jgi:hypothetical protein